MIICGGDSHEMRTSLSQEEGNMKRAEGILIKLIIIQIIFLAASQAALAREEWSVYMNKTFHYEGVSGNGGKVLYKE